MATRRARSPSRALSPRRSSVGRSAPSRADTPTPAPKRLVCVEVYKSISIGIMLAVHSLRRVPNGCSHADCNWTQAVWWLEGMAGVFFLISGLKLSLAICSQLDTGQLPATVLRAQLARSAVMLVCALLLGGVEAMVNAALPWPEYLGYNADTRSAAQRAMHQMIAQPHGILNVHAAAQAGAACFLCAMWACGLHSKRHPTALLIAALLVLVARTPAHRAADAITCCVPDRGLTEEERCFETPVPTARRPATFRLPAGCVQLRGAAAHAPGTPQTADEFGPCGFGQSGLGFAPQCSEREVAGGLASTESVGATAYYDAAGLGEPCEDVAPTVMPTCESVGPLRCGEDVDCPADVSERTCAWLAANGSCARRLGRGTAATTNLSHVTDACPLECTPFLCANSANMQRSLGGAPTAAPDTGEDHTAAGVAANKRCARRLAAETGDMAKVWQETHRLDSIPRRELGASWCPKWVISSVTWKPTAVAEVCALLPWWGRTGFSPELAAALATQNTGSGGGGGGRLRLKLALVWLLQWMVGPYGILGFAAPTLAGAAIGTWMHADGGRVSDALLRWGIACCALASGSGLLLSGWLLSPPLAKQHVGMAPGIAARLLGPSEQAFVPASASARLLWGGVDTAILLLVLGFAERHPTRAAMWQRCSVSLRRFGQLSFTIYATERTVGMIAATPIALAARATGWLPPHAAAGSAAVPEAATAGGGGGGGEITFRSGSGGHELLLLATAACPLVAWALLLAAWQRIAFAGSFEWLCSKLFSGAKPTAATPAATPVPPGGKGGGASAVEGVATHWERAQMLCVWMFIVWMPPIAWSVLASHVVAPLAQDYHWATNATSLLFDDRPYPSDDPRIGLRRIKMSVVAFVSTLVLALGFVANWTRQGQHTHTVAHTDDRIRALTALSLGAAWLALRVYSAGGLLWLSAPLLGYLRADAAVVATAMQAAAAGVLSRLHLQLPLALALIGALSLGLALPSPLVRVLPGGSVALSDVQRRGGVNASVDVMPSALSAATCGHMVAGVMAHRADWTHANIPGLGAPLPYFSFGVSSSFARAVEDAPVWWSWQYGFAAALGNEGAFALGVRGKAHRERSRALLRDARWLSDALRDALAVRLGVPAHLVVLGGESVISHLQHPAVNIYLPSAAWAVTINQHFDVDDFAPLLVQARGVPCDEDTRLAVLVPLLMPPAGAGLLYYNMLDEQGAPSAALIEHELAYELGSMYTWPMSLAHAVRPWPHIDWGTSALRLTLQAFGVRCGDEWFFYH